MRGQKINPWCVVFRKHKNTFAFSVIYRIWGGAGCCQGSLLRILFSFDTLRPRQNGRHFADDMFKCIFLNENVWIPIEISLKFVPRGSINNNPALFQIMAWRRPGDKPLSESMMVSSLTHIYASLGLNEWIPAWISNRMSRKVSDEIRYSFPNLPLKFGNGWVILSRTL